MADSQAGNRKSVTTGALREALGPLVDLLLEMGVTAVEAEDAMRDVFVKVASDQISRESPRVSLSRIALKCGLYRSEVRRRLDLAPSDQQVQREPDQHRLNRLLGAWHDDPDFTSVDGSPRMLPARGARSFESLVARYAANLYPAVILEELLRIGAVRIARAQRIEVLMREYVAKNLDTGRIQELGRRAQDILATLVDQVRRPRAGRVAVNAMGFNVAPEFLPLVRRDMYARAHAFAKLMDEDLNDPSRKARVGGVRVGMYLVSVEEEIRTPSEVANDVGRRAVAKRRGKSNEKRSR